MHDRWYRGPEDEEEEGDEPETDAGDGADSAE